MPEPLPLLPVDDWQTQLRDVVTSADRLLTMLKLRPEQVGFAPAACGDFALKVPVAFVDRMQVGNPRDPLLLQVIARGEELLEIPGYSTDPVGETEEANPRRGIIHKYRGRVLLIVSSGCAVNCRYCFRRHFPYSANQNSRAEWSGALDYVLKDNSIEEVILSGGDPLLATDTQLAELVTQIGAIPHVRRLRIHSRLPIVIPERVTAPLLDAITHPGLQTVMVVHCNHANEIDPAVGAAMQAMRQRGLTLFNQAVLLAGVNDSADALAELSEGLFAVNVLPYYLHLLDKVQGAAHFDVSAARGRQLIGEVSARLPGYLVPKLVREEAGAQAKTAVPPSPGSSVLLAAL